MNQLEEIGYLLVVKPEDEESTDPIQFIAIYKSKELANIALKTQKVKEIEDFLNYTYDSEDVVKYCQREDTQPPHVIVAQKLDDIDNNEEQWRWIKFCEKNTTWTKYQDSGWFYNVKKTIIEGDGEILDRVFREAFNITGTDSYRVTVELHEVPIL